MQSNSTGRDGTGQCRARAVTGRDTCLAHTPGIENVIDTDLRNSNLIVLGLMEGMEIDPDLLPTLIERQQVLGTNFRGATFNGTANFTRFRFNGDADFEGALFTDRAYFDGVAFTGTARFSGANFGYAEFTRATFTERAAFLGATFTDVAHFGQATFTGDAHFNDATFAATAYFNGATFGYAEFAEATFSVGAYFTKATFTGDVNFSVAEESEGVIVLSGTTFSAGARIETNTAMNMAELLIRDPLTVTAGGSRAAIVSLESCTLEAPFVVGDGVGLERCKLSYATGIDNLRILGTRAWGQPYRHRQVISDEPRQRRSWGRSWDLLRRKSATDPDVSDRTYQRVESSYRQLRAALESSKDYAGAADFYYGEMEMRRLGAHRLSVERPLLFAYKLLAGYGLRAYRALTTYAAVVLGSALLLRLYTGKLVVFETVKAFDGKAALDPTGNAIQVAKAAGSAGLHFNRFWDCVAISVRSTVSFLSPVTDGLTGGGTVLFVGMKIAGPLLLGLLALALRSRVQR